MEELEAEIDDEQLSNVRFGRSNFLRNAGLALFGLSAGLFAIPPREAAAAPRGAATAPRNAALPAEALAAAAAPGGPTTPAEGTIAGESVSAGRSTGAVIGSTVNHNLCICRGFIGNVC